MQVRRKLIVWLVVTGALLLFIFFDPSRYGIYPSCTWKEFTGTECPGCGSQRALHELLRGKLQNAWKLNPLVVTGLPVLALYLAAEAGWIKTGSKVHKLLFSKAVIWLAVAIVAAFWIFRITYQAGA